MKLLKWRKTQMKGYCGGAAGEEKGGGGGGGGI